MKCASWLAIGIAMTCALSACSRAQNPRSFNGNWDEGRARGIALQIARSWQFSTAEDLQGAQRNIYAVLPFDSAGTTRWLMLLAVSRPDQTCHACAPVTGAVLFAHKQSAWEAVYDQSQVVHLGANGQPPSARVQMLSPANPAVAFEVASMAQGYEATNLTLVADIQGHLREIVSLTTQENNEAAGLPEDQTFRWHATLETSPSSNTEFPDILVKCSGTKPAGEDQAIRPYATTLVYRFQDGAYRLAQ